MRDLRLPSPARTVPAMAALCALLADNTARASTKNIIPTADAQAMATQTLSLAAGEGASARGLHEALRRIPDAGARSLYAPADASTMRAQVEALLARSSEQELVVLTLSAPARAVGDRVELLGSDGQVAFDLAWLRRSLSASDAGFALILLELDWAAPPTLSQRDQVLQLSDVRPDILVLDGLALARPSARCPGQPRGSCALASALSPSADRSGDGALQGDELIAATRAWLSADGGSREDLRASGMLSALWQVKPGVEKLASNTRPSRASRNGPAAAAPSPKPPPPPTAPVPVELCLRANDQPVALDHVFRDGDALGLTLRVPESGYLALGSRGASGGIVELYPDARAGEDGRVTGGVTTLLPPRGSASMRFEAPAGTERLTLAWSPEGPPTKEVEQALKQSPGAPSPAAPSPAAPSPVESSPGSRVEVVQRDGRTKDIRRDSLRAEEASGCGLLQATGTDDLWILELTLQHSG